MDLTKNKSVIERWRHPRFFGQVYIDKPDGGSVTLSEEDMRHAKSVLRIKRGDMVIVCDNCIDYICQFGEAGQFSVIKSVPNTAEPYVNIRLFQCLPKSDKFNFIVQKAVELGVSEIVPITSTRCVSRPGPKIGVQKVERWNKIAYEAAKQCGRGRVPLVSEILKLKQALLQIKSDELNIIFYECGGKRLSDIITKRSASKTHKVVNLFIGSEGGFEIDEISLAAKHGAISATLGKRILRAETASVAGISVVMSLLGEI